MSWDLFCRVIDNHGDMGVCWRLAADLAGRGERVLLWVDDPSALAWMAPTRCAGVAVRAWPEDQHPTSHFAPGSVVIEAFGCELPAAFVAAMAAMATPPLWINLEYLSAEAYVERSHGLRSPQLSGPGAGLDKWFFYPGFTARTGGLLREPGLDARQSNFDRKTWLAARGWAPSGHEQVIVLFCYDNPALPQLIDSLSQRATLLLACGSEAQRQLAQLRLPASLRCIALPWLSQTDFDHLLWSADLNLVRGEDSFVRAMWAGASFVWQIYPQNDAAHASKLEAYLATFDSVTQMSHGPEWRALNRAWNGLGPWPAHWPAAKDWAAACQRWRAHLCDQADLASQLKQFAQETVRMHRAVTQATPTTPIKHRGPA